MSATSTPQKKPLTGGQQYALALAVAGMLAVGAYGLVISYWTVRELAVKLHMPLPHIFPVGIEGGMIAVLAIDIVLTWIGRPIGWLRQVARALSVTAISINAYAGWEYGAAAVVMHALAPAILIVGVEALRHHLLVVLQVPEEKEPIPRGRWALAPLSTVAMWRRMVLWQQPKYSEALDTHLDRHEAIVELRRAFGWRWKRAIPAGLAYRLSVGVRLEESTAEVRTILADHYAHDARTVDVHEVPNPDARELPPPAWVPLGARTQVRVGGERAEGRLSPGGRVLLPVRCAPRAQVQDAHARGDAAVAALQEWDAQGARARITPPTPDAHPAPEGARVPRMRAQQPTRPTWEPLPGGARVLRGGTRADGPVRPDGRALLGTVCAQHADTPRDAHDGRGPVDAWITEQGVRGMRDIARFLDRGDEGQGDAHTNPEPEPSAPTGAQRAARTRGDESRSRILAHLEEHPGARPAEIAEAVGLSASQVRRQLKVIRGEQ